MSVSVCLFVSLSVSVSAYIFMDLCILTLTNFLPRLPVALAQFSSCSIIIHCVLLLVCR